MSIADPDGAGPLASRLVIPNAFADQDGFSGGVGLWDGTMLSEFGPFSVGSIQSSAEFGGQLVVGGNFGADTTTFSVVRGTGSSWTPIGNTGGEASGTTSSGDMGMYALLVYNGNLVAGGAFSTIDGVAVNNIAMWDGTAWLPLGNFDGSVRALAVYNNDLYAAGAFSTVDGTPANNVAYYHGGAWHAAAGGVTFNTGFISGVAVNALAVFNGKLFVGGSFGRVDGVPTANIGAWDGTAWTTFGTGLDEGDPSFQLLAGVSTISVVNGSLYAGGTLSDADGVTVDGIARWDGSAWHAVGASPLEAGLGVGHLAVLSTHEFQGNLVAAGLSFDDGSTFLATYTPACCRVDFDADGHVAVADIFAFLNAWFAGDSRTDFDNDGHIAVADIFAFLNAWFAGC
jgi:hypothetical protein